MKQGLYFRIPEGRADLERLWTEAAPARGELPGWLRPAGRDAYRRIARGVPPDGHEQNRRTYFDELAQLEAASLVIDDVEGDRPEHAIYIPAPDKDEPWAIGVYEGSSPLALFPSAATASPVLTRDSVTDVSASFVADPFMIRVDDRWHMFFEVLNWHTNKGEIALATSADGLGWHYERVVLVEPFHLSYPFVFAWNDGIYMVPESGQSDTIRLYRSRRFPFEWELVDVLLSGRVFLDASLVQHNDRWWLFTALGPDDDTLGLYHAASPLGPWHEHPASPIVRGNPVMARPAGRPLLHQGHIIRFAQDCDEGYGRAVRAFRVTDLTATSYRETPVDGLVISAGAADWHRGGMHHIDAQRVGADKWLACVDGRQRVGA